MLLLDIGLLHDIVLGDSSKKNFFFWYVLCLLFACWCLYNNHGSGKIKAGAGDWKNIQHPFVKFNLKILFWGHLRVNTADGWSLSLCVSTIRFAVYTNLSVNLYWKANLNAAQPGLHCRLILQSNFQDCFSWYQVCHPSSWCAKSERRDVCSECSAHWPSDQLQHSGLWILARLRSLVSPLSSCPHLSRVSAPAACSRQRSRPSLSPRRCCRPPSSSSCASGGSWRRAGWCAASRCGDWAPGRCGPAAPPATQRAIRNGSDSDGGVMCVHVKLNRFGTRKMLCMSQAGHETLIQLD